MVNSYFAVNLECTRDKSRFYSVVFFESLFLMEIKKLDLLLNWVLRPI